MAKTRRVKKSKQKSEQLPERSTDPGVGRVSVTLGISADYGSMKYDCNTTQPMLPGETTDQAFARVQGDLEEVFKTNCTETFDLLRTIRRESLSNKRES